MQRAGPFTNAVLTALQAARGFLLRLSRAKRQIDFVKADFSRIDSPFIRFAGSICSILLRVEKAVAVASACHG